MLGVGGDDEGYLITRAEGSRLDGVVVDFDAVA